MTAYVIKFDLGDGMFAGMYKGAFGWAPTTATALTYEDRETAERVLANAYGPSMQGVGMVVPLDEVVS